MLSEAFPARLMKAIRLADHLDGAGIRSRRALLMDTPQWAMLASAAAVRVPSGETRALAISMLRTREDVRKRLACLQRRRGVLATQETA
jgi:hypothetical protein